MDNIVISEYILLSLDVLDASSTACPDGFQAILLKSCKFVVEDPCRFSFKASLQITGYEVS